MEIFDTVKKMVKEKADKYLEGNTLVTGKTIKRMAMVMNLDKMGQSTQDNGKMGYTMEKDR